MSSSRANGLITDFHAHCACVCACLLPCEHACLHWTVIQCDVYWTVHHCDNWRIKKPNLSLHPGHHSSLTAPYLQYNKQRTILLRCAIPVVRLNYMVNWIQSTCFGHYYAHHQELATTVLSTTLVVSFLYGEVNSVKKHNYEIWLNDGVY